MLNQVEIETDAEEIIEVSRSEWDAVTMFGVKVAEQNALVLDSIKTLTEQVKQQGDILVSTFAAIRDALTGMSIVVNVPEQAAPIVQPEIIVQPANVQVEVPRAIREKQKVKRNKNGFIESTDTQIEYE